MMRYKRTGKIEKDLTSTKKKFTCKALIVTFQKTQEFLTFFSRLYLYFPDFFQVWKIVGQNNFRTFSRIQDSVQTLITETANAEYPRSQTHKGTLLLALQTQDTYSDLELLPLLRPHSTSICLAFSSLYSSTFVSHSFQLSLFIFC